MLSRLSVLTAVAACSIFASPASADIEKIMNNCGGKLCPFFRASITPPEGWVEDKEATRELRVQMLLPKGQDFEQAPAKIYALVKYNARDKQQIADIVQQTQADWKMRAKAGKTEKLADAARDNGQPAFVSYKFEAAKLKEQGFERTSIVTDKDNDGNTFFVLVVLSANSRDAYAKAEAAYNSVLKSY